MIAEAIRKAAKKSGVSMYRVSADTGISQATLSRFMAGKNQVSLEYADILCGYFGLELKPKARAKKKRK